MPCTANSLTTSIGTPRASAWRTKVWPIQCGLAFFAPAQIEPGTPAKLFARVRDYLPSNISIRGSGVPDQIIR